MALTAIPFDSDERMIKTQRCYRCGGEYLLIFFRADRRLTRKARYHAVCIGCQLSAEVERARANRHRKKARAARTRHAARYLSRAVADSYVLPESVKTSEDFYKMYDWSVDQMTHDIEHAGKNGCPYCWQLFSTMPHGLGDMTLDIVDRRLPPYYTTNARWVCATCNKEKQRTPPDLWGAKLAMWKLWRENQQKLLTDPAALGFLPFFIDPVPRAS